MSEDKDLKPSLEEAPEFPHGGHQLTPVEAKLEEAARIKPQVTIIDENGATNVTGRKIVSQEQIEKRFSDDSAPYSEKNPEFVNIAGDIPSSMAFYPGNSLCIRTFKSSHIIKLIDGMELEDLGVIVDTVSAVLEPSFSALDLTPEDFFYCLYWLKINSFKKHPYEIEFICTNVKHHEDVLTKKLPQETLRNKTLVKQVGQLTIDKITENSLAVSTKLLQEIKENYGVDVFAMRMRDYVDLQGYLKRSAMFAVKIAEFEEAGTFDSPELEELKAKKRELDAMYAMKDYAPYICLPDPKATIADKINYLNSLDLDPDFFIDLDAFIQSLAHGVRETAVVHCQECKAKVEVPVSIEALHFFPEIIRRRFAQ